MFLAYRNKRDYSIPFLVMLGTCVFVLACALAIAVGGL